MEEKVYNPFCGCIFTKRAQRKEEERAAKEIKDKTDRERKTYDDMYGRAAVEKAMENKSEDYDPEEDFW